MQLSFTMSLLQISVEELLPELYSDQMKQARQRGDYMPPPSFQSTTSYQNPLSSNFQDISQHGMVGPFQQNFPQGHGSKYSLYKIAIVLYQISHLTFRF